MLMLVGTRGGNVTTIITLHIATSGGKLYFILLLLFSSLLATTTLVACCQHGYIQLHLSSSSVSYI
jgi:hypothetical protein